MHSRFLDINEISGMAISIVNINDFLFILSEIRIWK